MNWNETLHKTCELSRTKPSMLVSDGGDSFRSSLQDPNRPLVRSCFLDATGVGKQNLPKALAEDLFGFWRSYGSGLTWVNHGKTCRVSLLCRPPGYIWLWRRCQLDRSVRRNAYKQIFVLLEKFWKKGRAQIVFKYFKNLQVLKMMSGLTRFSKVPGGPFELKDTVLIMTSNMWL